MMNKRLLAGLGVGLFGLIAASAAQAASATVPDPDRGVSPQVGPSLTIHPFGGAMEGVTDPRKVRLQQDAPPRQRRRDPRSHRRDTTQALTPEQVMRAAAASATAAGVTCDVTEAAALGVTSDTGNAIFEVACATGPGYIIVTTTPAQTYDCVALQGAAETARAADPNANVGQQCTLPVNQDPVRVISQYAAAAGVPCTPDQAAAIGVNRYEVGCAGQDGYWLDRNADGTWNRVPCWDLATENHSCRYTTEGERRGAWRQMVAGTGASACDVQNYRRVGRDAQGLILYELQCNSGNGYFVRMNNGDQIQRVHTCQEAVNIGGGCTLTRAAPAGGRP